MQKLLLFTFLILSALGARMDAQNCEITAVTAVPLPCQGNFFNVTVNLTVDNPASPGFTLAGNGVIYGTYLYSDLPVTVGPLLGDDESEYEFIAWDVEDATCQNFITIPAANCGPICSISNFQLEFLTCVSNQSALVVFDFDVTNPTGNTFDLYNADGENIGTWLYASLPVTVPFFEVNGAAPIKVTVCDHENNACCETFTLPAIDCNPDDCEIFSVNIDPECTGNNFLVHIDFGYDNVASDSFNLTANNLNFGTFGYNELPITVGPLNGNSNINWVFQIADSETPACSATGPLGVYHCPPPCSILGMEAMALECNGNEAYALEVGLDIEGEGDNGFAVFSDNAYYGSYAYNELPLVLPAYEGSGEFIDIVSVCDNENLGCCSTTPFEALLCAGCIIYNLTATPQPCDGQGNIFVQIDFDHQNNSQDGFEVTGNNNNYGQFAYEDLPILVGPFAGDGSQYFEFVVTDLVNPLCFEAVELGFVNCDTICQLSNLQVETGDCTGNNTYVLHADFDYQGVSGVGFDLFANGEYYDSYSYDDLPLTIADFPSSGTGTDTITVCENGDAQCCTTLAFDAPNCACNIYDASAENLGCTSDTTFRISLEFFYENLPGNSVDVFLDGVLIGFYNVADIPLLMDIPEGSGTAVVTVCANDLNNCCDNVVIERTLCEPPPCHVSELFAEAGDCNTDSTYVLDFTFQYENLPTDSIIVTANGEFVGQYLIATPFNQITNFPDLDADTTVLTVCAVGAPDCCASYSFATPDCSLFGHCNIWDLVSELGDCTSDTTYNLHVDFNYQNLPTDSVIITANGNYIGQFQVQADPFIIPNVPVYGTDFTVLSVCAVGDAECCESHEYATPDCAGGGTCGISELVADPGECTTDSTYNLFVHYNTINFPGDSVTINANGQFIGTFAHQPDGFTIPNFPVFDANGTEIVVCALAAPDCCDAFEFLTPDCSEAFACHITELIADPGGCNGDSTYSLFIHYQAANLPGDSVVVSSADGYTATFVHLPDGFAIPDFPAFNTSHTTISVCAQGGEDCCAEIEFLTPDCGQGFNCEIYGLFAEAGECTSDTTYVVDIVFQGYNLGADSVVVWANDQNLGHYQVPADFIHIENFPHLPGEQTTVTVCAMGNEECCASYSFETPACDQSCLIDDVAVTVFNCNSDTTFGVVVNFTYQNIPGGGFDIYAGDQYLGFYTFEQIPAEISNFPANATGQYSITICESDGTACCTSHTFEGPVCAEPGCSISNLAYTLTECDTAGQFYFILDFDFSNPGTQGYNVVGNGNEYGNFSYDNIPVQIGPFETDDTPYEFLVFDAEHPGCFDVIEPGIVHCFVSTDPVDYDQFFTLFNNGAVPGIYAKKDIVLSVYHSNGKNVLYHYPLSADERYQLSNQPAGLYIATITHGGQVWPVKLVKSGN